MTTALAHSWYVGLRDLRNLARQPWWIGISLAQPLVYLLLFSAAVRPWQRAPTGASSSQGAYLLGFAVACAWLATRAFRAYQRSV